MDNKENRKLKLFKNINKSYNTLSKIKVPFQKVHLCTVFTPKRYILVPEVYILVHCERVPSLVPFF